MKVNELISILSGYNGDADIAILGGENGYGIPREINFGPVEYTIHDKSLTKSELDNISDINSIVGDKIVIIGFGCY